jgi:phospholipase D1/2
MILVYNEPTLALNNDSYHTKTHLESLSRNIKVLRHPGQKIPYLWSHHEKLVVIDQKVGFMGGLDLCFGRMDSNEHYLFDQAYETSDKTAHDWPGIDYSNSRVKDFYNVK